MRTARKPEYKRRIYAYGEKLLRNAKCRLTSHQMRAKFRLPPEFADLSRGTPDLPQDALSVAYGC